MSQISQVQIKFSPVEDRLLLRMNTSSSVGFEFLLTRRYVKLLWPVLMDMLQKDQQITSQSTPEAKKEVLSFQHEAAAQNMDYSKAYNNDIDQRPLGDEPILLAKISVKQPESGPPVLSLLPEQGQGIEIAMQQQLLHSFCKLLGDTVSKTDWSLNLSAISADTVEDQAPEAGLVN